MDARNLMSNFLAILAAGEPARLAALFSTDGVVVSPLYGTQPGRDFAQALAADTVTSEISLRRYFMAPDSVSAVQFRYGLSLTSGEHLDVECVSVFEFGGEGRIKKLTLIFDAQSLSPRILARMATSASTAAPRPGVIPIDAPADPPSQEEDQEHRHSPSADEITLSAEAEGLLAALPDEERPVELTRSYPRIINAIASHRKNIRELEHYFISLLTPDRKDRHGFPFKVLMELESLKIFMLREHHKPDPFWD